jgi:hypothetical protein
VKCKIKLQNPGGWKISHKLYIMMAYGKSNQ